MTTEELHQRLENIDKATTASRPHALDILKGVNAAFPLAEVMPPEFDGSHFLTLTKDGKLLVAVWCDNMLHPVVFD